MKHAVTKANGKDGALEIESKWAEKSNLSYRRGSYNGIHMLDIVRES